ncbi:MAG: Isoprenylcysteine carboxyl methyltransferase [Xanthobacteraceae bacterium]|nr:Isoprenylcysteine carboxyl methyltransferase [Xanthobacteraceae bacterium]
MGEGFWAEGIWLVGFVAVQRVGELVFVARNTRRLVRAGGVEVGRADYPLVIALHAAWLIGVAILGHAQPVNVGLLAVFFVVEAGRLWVVTTLGRRWTTRVIVVPGEVLVRRGPYRLLRHPNYVIVALEIALVPLILGLPVFAVVFSLLNAAVLYRRIRVENEALGRIA